jgi:hypothetical protein
VRHSIDDLRTHLFDTLRALRDPTTPMEIDRAKAIAEVSRAVIDSAKVEVDYLRVVGKAYGTGFIEATDQGPALAKSSPKAVPLAELPSGVKRRCQACSQMTAGNPCTHCGRPA